MNHTKADAPFHGQMLPDMSSKCVNPLVTIVAMADGRARHYVPYIFFPFTKQKS